MRIKLTAIDDISVGTEIKINVSGLIKDGISECKMGPLRVLIETNEEEIREIDS